MRRIPPRTTILSQAACLRSQALADALQPRGAHRRFGELISITRDLEPEYRADNSYRAHSKRLTREQCADLEAAVVNFARYI